MHPWTWFSDDIPVCTFLIYKNYIADAKTISTWICIISLRKAYQLSIVLQKGEVEHTDRYSTVLKARLLCSSTWAYPFLFLTCMSWEMTFTPHWSWRCKMIYHYPWFLRKREWKRTGEVTNGCYAENAGCRNKCWTGLYDHGGHSRRDCSHEEGDWNVIQEEW